jgi:hypothetical protein
VNSILSENKNMKKLSFYLSYAGALPLIICTACFWLDVTVIPLLGTTEQILSVYLLSIATFMAGSHWGQHLHLENHWEYYLPILSNIITIVLWLSFLWLPFKPLLASFVVIFLGLLVIDQRLFQYGLITQHYFRTRCLVTTLVILTIIISGIMA